MEKNRKKYFGGNEAYDYYPKLIKKITLSEKEKILDVGCGVGNLSKYLKGFNLYGCDFVKEFVEEARKKDYKEVKIADICNLPYKNKEFDKIICLGVFIYLENPKKAIKELMRVCKGNIIIVNPNFNFASIKYMNSRKRWVTFINSIKNKELFWTNKIYFVELAEQCDLNLEIRYISRSWGFIRNLFGNLLASEVVVVAFQN